jgi:hypothetical protein
MVISDGISVFPRNRKSRNSVPNPSAEEKTEQHGIPFRGTKIEANSHNSFPNHSAEENTTKNKSRQPNISKIVSNKTTFDVQTNYFVILLLFRKTSFFRGILFRSIPFRFSEMALPRNYSSELFISPRAGLQHKQFLDFLRLYTGKNTR